MQLRETKLIETVVFHFVYVLRKVRIGKIPESGNSHFVGRCRNSYFAQCNIGIARVQSGNRDTVRIRMIALVSSLLIILNRG